MIVPGLCAACAWSRAVPSSRGATYVRCARAETDPAYDRYPRLPVVACPGYETRGEVSS
jgi:hypothetical protein